MGHLYLVRHGQASLGEDNYDQLSELGIRQSQRLGDYWREMGLRFDTVMIGSLERHAQTLAGIAQGMQHTLPATVWPGLNEYDAEAVIASIHPAPRARPTTPQAYRQHFRLLREGLMQWMRDEVAPQGMGTWTSFVQGVQAALDHAHASNGDVLVVSSGGPISVALGQLLRTPAESVIEMNLQMRNTSVSELRAGKDGFRVVSFNTLPHLASADKASWISYA